MTTALLVAAAFALSVPHMGVAADLTTPIDASAEALEELAGFDR